MYNYFQLTFTRKFLLINSCDELFSTYFENHNRNTIDKFRQTKNG